MAGKSNGSVKGVSGGVQELPDVDERQQLAILALVSGSSDVDAAKAAGVDRSTLHRWRNQDAAFAASLNLARQTVWADTTDALRAAVSEAVAVLLQDLRADDPDVKRRAAATVLKLTGVPELAPTGKTTARQQELAWNAERRVGVLELFDMGM